MFRWLRMSDVVPADAAVSFAAGIVNVYPVPVELALVNVVAPVDEPSSLRSLFVYVCAAVHVLALPTLSEATTAPVVGEIVSELSLLETLETAPPPPPPQLDPVPVITPVLLAWRQPIIPVNT